MSSSRLLSLVLGAAFAVGAGAQMPPPLPVERPPPLKVSPASLAKYWLVANSSIEADVPNVGRNLDKPTCAAVSYIIETDGTTSHWQLDKVVPDGDLGMVALSVVKGLRYGPGPENKARVPVQTRVVLPLNMPEATGDAAHRAEINAFRERAVAACEPEPAKPPKKL